MTAGGAIVLDRLSKRYGERRGIEKVSLQVEPGEVFGFLGPNGAGKTTTIRMLLDHLRPTEGKGRIARARFPPRCLGDPSPRRLPTPATSPRIAG
jgi:ABC-type multidrug transport system ATPase subunit